jgi:hypothetical protein
MRTLCRALAVALLFTCPSHAAKERQPETVWDLIHALNYAFRQVLTPDELETMKGKHPEEVRAANPDLYGKISRVVKRATDDWTREAAKKHKKIPEDKMAYAREAVADVDAVLKPYFESRGWPYRPINAVFLPQALFHDRTERGSMTLGVFMPYYSEVFYATVNPSIPTRMVLIHETFHFNERGSWIGHPLREGIADTIARELAVKHAMVQPRKLKSWAAYEGERGTIDYLIERIVERTGGSREDAVEALVASYVTGDHGAVVEIFGSAAWDNVLRASRLTSSLDLERFKAALREILPPAETEKKKRRK